MGKLAGVNAVRWLGKDGNCGWGTDQRPFVRAAGNYRFYMFGQLNFDAVHFRNVFDQHEQNVLLAFRNRTSQP